MLPWKEEPHGNTRQDPASQLLPAIYMRPILDKQRMMGTGEKGRQKPLKSALLGLPRESKLTGSQDPP